MLFWCVLTASPLTCSDKDTHLLWQFIAVLFLCRQVNTGLNKDCITKTFRPVKLLLATVSWPGDLLSSGAAPRWRLGWGKGGIGLLVALVCCEITGLLDYCNPSRIGEDQHTSFADLKSILLNVCVQLAEGLIRKVQTSSLLWLVKIKGHVYILPVWL